MPLRRPTNANDRLLTLCWRCISLLPCATRIYTVARTYVSYGSPDTNGNERCNEQQFSRLNVTALRLLYPRRAHTHARVHIPARARGIVLIRTARVYCGGTGYIKTPRCSGSVLYRRFMCAGGCGLGGRKTYARPEERREVRVEGLDTEEVGLLYTRDIYYTFFFFFFPRFPTSYIFRPLACCVCVCP